MWCAALIGSVLVVSSVSRIANMMPSDRAQTSSNEKQEAPSMHRNKTNIFSMLFSSMVSVFRREERAPIETENNLRRPTAASRVVLGSTFDYTYGDSTKIVSVKRLATMYRYMHSRVSHHQATASGWVVHHQATSSSRSRHYHTTASAPRPATASGRVLTAKPWSTDHMQRLKRVKLAHLLSLAKRAKKVRPTSKRDNRPYEHGERTQGLRQALARLNSMNTSDDLLVHQGGVKWYIRNDDSEIHRIVLLAPGRQGQDSFLAQSEDGKWHKFVKPALGFLRFVARLPRQYESGKVSCDSKNWYIRDDNGLYRRLVNQGLIVQENNAHVQSEDGVWYRLRNETHMPMLLRYIKKLSTYQPESAETDVEPTDWRTDRQRRGVDIVILGSSQGPFGGGSRKQHSTFALVST